MKNEKIILEMEKRRKKNTAQMRVFYNGSIYQCAQRIVRSAVLAGFSMEKARADILRDLSYVFHNTEFLEQIEKGTTRFDK